MFWAPLKILRNEHTVITQWLRRVIIQWIPCYYSYKTLCRYYITDKISRISECIVHYEMTLLQLMLHEVGKDEMNMLCNVFCPMQIK